MKMLSRVCLLFIVLISLDIEEIFGFYVPGIAPVEFKKGDPVEVKAVKMTSSRTQLPYEYYSMPFCRPEGDILYKSLNLGEVLRGDRIVNTPYKLSMRENVSCRQLCEQPMKPDEAKMLQERISEAYSVHLLVDNLPAATKLHLGGGVEQYGHGYYLGFSRNDKHYLNNHLKLVIKYHTDDGEIFRVVGFEVEPSSHSSLKVNAGTKDCVLLEGASQSPFEITDSVSSVSYSYEVSWESSEVRWPSRWDTYLSMSDVQIHWFSIINSLVIILFLAGILTMIMIRTLRRDIAKYNQDEDMEESLEESGWKLVHGDVFRPPQHPRLLSAFVGSGVQLFLMLFITIFFAMLGMLSPASRGALMSMGIFSFVFMGLFAGYYASRLYKTLRGQQWKTAALWTTMVVPSFVLSICFLLNLFVWVKHSSGAVPFSTMVALICMWLGISLPLGIVGAYFGYRKAPYQHPVRTNQIPRAVPPQKWYHSLPICVFVAGVLPFGALFIELFFIFTAIWERQFYYMFGFLFLVFLILVVSVSQISVVLTYFQLCAEDYHWWWRSFITSGGSAIYVMAYSVFYFSTKLEITDFVPTLLYFGYTFIMALLLFILTGSIGFYASYYFITKIYGAIKID